MHIRILILLSILFSYAHAVEILKIEIGRVDSQSINRNKLIHYTYGNVYRRIITKHGKVSQLDSLRDVFLGELREMKRIEKIGWYFSGVPTSSQRRNFRWGKAHFVNGKQYTPFRGLRRIYKKINKYKKYKKYKYKDDYYSGKSRDFYNDKDDDYSDDDYSDDDYSDDDYNNNDYSDDDDYNDDYKDDDYKDDDYKDDDYYRDRKKKKYTDLNNYRKHRKNYYRRKNNNINLNIHHDENNNEQSKDSFVDEDNYVDKNTNITEENYTNQDDYSNEDLNLSAKETYSDENYPKNKKRRYSSDDSNLSKNLQQLAHSLMQEDSLSKREEIFSENFGNITKNQKNLAKKINMALQLLSKKTKGIFYVTAIQSCIQKGSSRGFTYYLSQLHKLTFEKDALLYARVYKNDDRYFGQWYEGKCHGYGTLTKKSGAKYNGQWRYNERNGVGMYEWPDGSFYIGDWRDNHKNGHGTLVSANGFIHRQGWWKQDAFIGEKYSEDDFENKE